MSKIRLAESSYGLPAKSILFTPEKRMRDSRQICLTILNMEISYLTVLLDPQRSSKRLLLLRTERLSKDKDYNLACLRLNLLQPMSQRGFW